MTSKATKNLDAALIYCRVSSEKQKEEGHGLDAQESNCRKFAKEIDLKVERCFRDSFTGGGDFRKRPEFSSLINYLDENPHKEYAVVISDLDRLARDTQSHMEIRTELKARNAQLKCLNYKLDDSPEGKFVETVFAGKNQLEREQNKRRVIKKQKARLEDGYWTFTAPPGYVYDEQPEHGKILVPDEKTAPIYTEALKSFASGRFSNREELRKFLEDSNIAEIEGVKNVNYSRANRLLRRVIYAGYIEYQNWDVTRREGHHEALIGLETYNAIQSRLENDNHLYPERQDINPRFPARGMVVCSECSSPLTGSVTTGNGGKYRYYRCNNSSCELGGRSVSVEDLHEELKDLLIELKPASGAVNMAEKIMKDVWEDHKENQERRRSQIKEEIDKKDNEIERIVEKASSTDSKRVTQRYEEKIDKLDREQQELEEKLEKADNNVELGTAIEDVSSFLSNPCHQWISGDVHRRRLVLKTAFEEKPPFQLNEGFETTEEALLLDVFRMIDGDCSRDVQVVQNNWNQLEEYIVWAHELLESDKYTKNKPTSKDFLPID